MADFGSALDVMMQTIRRLALVVAISGTLGMLMFAFLHFSKLNYFPLLTETPSGFTLSAMMGAIIGVASYSVNKLLDKWLPWRNLFIARFICGYIVSFLVSMSMAYLTSEAILYFFGPESFWVGYARRDHDMSVRVAILLSSTIFIYTVVYALLYSYQQYAVAQLESMQKERKQLELQFEALKSQLSPHYLFNSLNTISSLIYKDTPSAEQFVRRLAQTYHYILSTQRSRYVTLKEEVDFVTSYYYLLRIRFQQQLNLEVNLPNSILASRIPPLTLQILVENAVKHNVLTGDHKLYIYISARDNTELKVVNTKLGGKQSVTSFKLGLDNIKKRYAFFTDRKIEIQDEEQFSVTLPVIPNKHADSGRIFKHSA
ncbi:MAG: histidine kinase [Chryseolinea sp.]